MNAAEVATALGAAYRSGQWWRSPCPAHNSDGLTLALRDGDGGLIVYCHAGCTRAEILTELRRRGLNEGEANCRLPDPADTAQRRDAERRDRERRIALARDIIAASLPAGGTVVERYLASRCITILPQAIRYLPMHDVYARHPRGGRRPVMIAAVEHVEHGIVGAHRTWLTPDGLGKASLDPVRISTGPIKGGAVRLAAAADTLMVGEGIETCLSAMQATSIPAWAALSTSGIKALILPPLPLAAAVVILADNDRSGVGQRAAQSAAERWLAEGRRVRIATPPKPGTDFNDVLLGLGYAEVRDAA
jgi:hypothetical protein